jgi:hypothetical protein
MVTLALLIENEGQYYGKEDGMANGILYLMLGIPALGARRWVLGIGCQYFNTSARLPVEWSVRFRKPNNQKLNIRFRSAGRHVNTSTRQHINNPIIPPPCP